MYTKNVKTTQSTFLCCPLKREYCTFYSPALAIIRLFVLQKRIPHANSKTFYFFIWFTVFVNSLLNKITKNHLNSDLKCSIEVTQLFNANFYIIADFQPDISLQFIYYSH